MTVIVGLFDGGGVTPVIVMVALPEPFAFVPLTVTVPAADGAVNTPADVMLPALVVHVVIV
jgi:hypothetical protein